MGKVTRTPTTNLKLRAKNAELDAENKRLKAQLQSMQRDTEKRDALKLYGTPTDWAWVTSYGAGWYVSRVGEGRW
jgi:predicted RNase H-like nuclease (RuvC/YqgF family)